MGTTPAGLTEGSSTVQHCKFVSSHASQKSVNNPDMEGKNSEATIRETSLGLGVK